MMNKDRTPAQKNATTVACIATIIAISAFISSVSAIQALACIGCFITCILYFYAKDWIWGFLWTFNTISWILVLIYGAGFLSR